MSEKDEPPGSHLLDGGNGGDPRDSIIKVLRRLALKALAWGSIYLLGYWDFSMAWLLTPLLLTVLREQWKKERNYKLLAARHAALTNEKEMIESRVKLEDLPSWVFFPDKERAEWINTILTQLWPNVGHLTRKLISSSVEPAIRAALTDYKLTGFKFERVVLGQIPPRITGIKVYDRNVSRSEIIMDLDIIHASDCDIKCSLKRMKVKVSDFSLRGVVRVVLKPLITDIPIVGGVQVYFLTPPEIDFDLGGLANALDVPGLSNIIRKVVLENIAAVMVLPNKICVPLTDVVKMQALKCPQSAGVLRVHLKRASNLVKEDVGVLGMGKSDPFAELSVGARKVTTPRINNTVNPEWDFVADFPIEVISGQRLTIEVFDHDENMENDYLGSCTVETGIIAEKGLLEDMWADLEGVASGRVQLTLSWLKVTCTDPTATALKTGARQGSQNRTKALLHVYVDSCSNLELRNRPEAKVSPLVELRVGQEEKQATFPVVFNNDPVFEEGFVFLVTNPAVDDLHVSVIDERRGGGGGSAGRSSVLGTKEAPSHVLGKKVIHLSRLMLAPGLELPCQPTPLCGGGCNASITIGAHLRFLQEPMSSAASSAAEAGGPVAAAAAMSSTAVQSAEAAESIANEHSTSSSAVDSEAAALPAALPAAPAAVASSCADALRAPSPPPAVAADARMSLDAMITNTIAPAIKAADVDVNVSALMTAASVVRQRTNRATGHTAADQCGKVKLTVKLDPSSARLTVVVHEASGLPGAELPDPPDPYVKLYLLATERIKKSKCKTDVVKDTTSPRFEETFKMDLEGRRLDQVQLEVSVVDKKGIFARSPLMGRAVVPLDEPEIAYDQGPGLCRWIALHEEDDDSD